MFPVIQLARLSGFSPIITTASLKHTENLESLGATAVFDRDLPASDLAKEIKKLTNEPIKFVYDSISSKSTQETGVELLAPGGQITVVLAVTAKTDEGKSALRIIGLARLPPHIELVETLYHDKIAGFLEQGIIKVHGFSTCFVSEISPSCLLCSRTRSRFYPTVSLAFLTAWRGWKQTKYPDSNWLLTLRKTFRGELTVHI